MQTFNIVAYSILVYSSDDYYQQMKSYSNLKKRNFTLHKQKKQDSPLSFQEEDEYQTNLTLMKHLK